MKYLFLMYVSYTYFGNKMISYSDIISLDFSLCLYEPSSQQF